jgi:Fic family protein
METLRMAAKKAKSATKIAKKSASTKVLRSTAKTPAKKAAATKTRTTKPAKKPTRSKPAPAKTKPKSAKAARPAAKSSRKAATPAARRKAAPKAAPKAKRAASRPSKPTVSAKRKLSAAKKRTASAGIKRAATGSKKPATSSRATPAKLRATKAARRGTAATAAPPSRRKPTKAAPLKTAKAAKTIAAKRAKAVVAKRAKAVVAKRAKAIVAKPAKAVVAAKPAKAVVAAKPAKAVVAAKPAKAVVAAKPAKAVVAAKPAKAVATTPGKAAPANADSVGPTATPKRAAVRPSKRAALPGRGEAQPSGLSSLPARILREPVRTPPVLVTLPIPVLPPIKRLTIEERSASIDARLEAQPVEFQKRYIDSLDMSWIYHDSALDGVVYTFEELRNALSQDTQPVAPAPLFTDDELSEEAVLQPTYDAIRRHKEAIAFVRDFAIKKRLAITIDVIKKIYLILRPEDGDIKNVKYRKDVPQHRLYFHEYVTPDKIPYKVRQVVDWLNDPETKKTRNGVRIAARAHYDLLRVFPFPVESGKVARLFMNLLLLRSGLPPSIIHSTERQRYYEALKGSAATVLQMVQESVDNALASVEKLLDEHELRGRAFVG